MVIITDGGLRKPMTADDHPIPIHPIPLFVLNELRDAVKNVLADFAR